MPIDSPANVSTPQTQNSTHSFTPVPTQGTISADTRHTARLARLILAEEKLQESNSGQTGQLTHSSDTSDLVQLAITGSIMNSYYSTELRKAQEKDGEPMN